MRFVHRFDEKTVAELTVADTPPLSGANYIHQIQWSARPKRKHLPEYIKWVHTVNEHLSSLWGIKITHCIQISSKNWQCWNYQPGKPAEKIP